MDKTIPLTQLKSGEEATVIGFSSGKGLVHKLDSLGLRRGKKVKMVSCMLFHGPITVKVDGMAIALGYGMASKVMVSKDQAS